MLLKIKIQFSKDKTLDKFSIAIKHAWRISTFIIGIIIVVVSISFAFDVYDKMPCPPNLYEMIYSGLYYILCSIFILVGVVLMK